MSMNAGFTHLGAFGQHVGAAPVFAEAIARCNESMRSMLPSARAFSVMKGSVSRGPKATGIFNLFLALAATGTQPSCGTSLPKAPFLDSCHPITILIKSTPAS